MDSADILAASALLDMMVNGVWEDGPRGLQQDLQQDLMDLQQDPQVLMDQNLVDHLLHQDHLMDLQEDPQILEDQNLEDHLLHQQDHLEDHLLHQQDHLLHQEERRQRELKMGRRRRAEQRRASAQRILELHQHEHLDQTQNVPEATHGRAGRPPKSDDGAVWCVQFKRAVATAKPTARVGLKEAIDAFHAFHADQGTTTTLALATVRKRVENLYGVTWSKVASQECPETHRKPTCEGVADMAVKYGDR